MPQIVALGELLIDFTPVGVNDVGIAVYERNPGGAPANVLAMASKLGSSTAFIGKVGNDSFGRYLKSVLVNSNIDTSGLLLSDEYKTTLAFVNLDENGDRDFDFYRGQGADTMLRPEEIDSNIFDECELFHFGSVSLTCEPSRSATIAAAREARRRGKRISFDPNYRQPLWRSEAEAKEEILKVVPLANILKVSEEEMVLLTGVNDLEQGAAILSEMGPEIVLVSRGSSGAFYYTKDYCAALPTYAVDTIDATGAGDVFLGVILNRLLGSASYRETGIIGQTELNEIVDFANAAGSIATTRYGAIPSFPDLKEIEYCRSTYPYLEC